MADAENQVVSSVNYLDEDSGRDRNGRRLYPVMSATFRKFFEGRNYRWLEPVRGMDRVTFLTKCADIVERTARESLEMAVEAAGPKGLSERGRRDALDSGRMAAMRRLGLSYLFYFAVVILKHDWLNNDYAYRLCLDVQKNKWSKHVMLWIIAREHYKSTIITKISTLWEIMQNPENTYCIMTFEEGLSVDFLGYIKTQCETNELLRALYPDVIWEDPAKGYQVDESTGVKTTWTWNSTALEFRRQSHPNEKTVEAFAVRGGSITGRHFSHLIMDDIETESMTKTENFIENMKNTVTNLFKAGRSDDLHVTMVGTFYTVNDLYCKLIKDDIIDESIIQSAIDQETRHPIKYTDEAMEQVIKSSTPAIFATQVMCDPSFSISAKFVYDRILRWHPVNLDGLNIYVFVDPAGTKTNRSDYTAILTAGYDINRNVMVIDLIRDKLTLDEKFSHLARIMRRYRPIAIYYEQAREHYKSTIITKISTLWEIMQNPENTYCIMTFEEGLSVDFLGYIKTQCETNELLRALYPDVIWEDPAKGYQVDESTGVKTTWTWNSTALEFRRQSHPNEKTVEAFAVRGGSITGRHFSHLIMDDIETESMTKTENFIENMKNTVTNLFKAGRSDDLHVTMVGTFYTVNDLYCKLIKDDIIDESIIQSAIDQETRHPIKYTDEAMEQVIKSSTPAIFATQVMCDPSFSISAKFVYDRILRWHPVNLDGLNIYVFVDPAGTKTNRSDYTAILTAGYDINRNVMVIDLIRDKLTLDEKFSHLARIMRRYRPIAIYYEQVGMQADIAYLQQKMQQTNIRFPIIPESPPRGVTKQVRIEQIIFRMNTIYLPHPGDNVFINWQGVPEDMVESMVNDEMMPFPNATHDDALDTLAKAVAAMDGGFVAVPDMEELRTGAGAGGQIEADYDPMDYAKRLISG